MTSRKPKPRKRKRKPEHDPLNPAHPFYMEPNESDHEAPEHEDPTIDFFGAPIEVAAAIYEQLGVIQEKRADLVALAGETDDPKERKRIARECSDLDMEKLRLMGELLGAGLKKDKSGRAKSLDRQA